MDKSNRQSSYISVLSIGMFLALTVNSGCNGYKSETPGNRSESVNSMIETERDAGWVLLFDGETLSNWRGLGREDIPEGHWIVEDGTIRKIATSEVARLADGQPAIGGDILYDNKFRNFELSFEWKVSPGANSGIKYNVSEEFSTAHQPARAALGFEYQILDDELHPDAGNDPNRLAAGLYDLIPPGSNARLNPVGSWNTGRIVFNGNRGEHWLNGEMVLEYELGTYMMDRLLETSKWGDMPDFGVRREAGYIVLQDHGDDVWYRNIRLRELTP